LKSIEAGSRLEELSFVSETLDITAPEDNSEVNISSEQQSDSLNKTTKNQTKSGISEKANRWLNSPWDTSWQDVKKEIKK